MSNGATIDPKALHVQFGPYTFKKGRAKGDWLSVVYTSDAFVMNGGVDGEVFFVALDDESALVSMTFQQSAEANDILSSIHIADRATPGGFILPIVIKETNGRSVYSGAHARVMKIADGVWSDGGTVRTWTVGVARLKGFVGGVGPTPQNPAP